LGALKRALKTATSGLASVVPPFATNFSVNLFHALRVNLRSLTTLVTCKRVATKRGDPPRILAGRATSAIDEIDRSRHTSSKVNLIL